jgi:murein DD-endopeptidase MepM/ murein hydrolase activator NlpD
MQARLRAAEERLATAKAELEAGRVALEEQRVAVTRLISSIYTEGDPEILAFSALLRAQTTADLTRQSKVREIVVGNETDSYEDLAIAERALEAKKAQVKAATIEVAARRREAAQQLVLRQELEAHAETAARDVVALVRARASARAAAGRAVRADRQKLRALRAHQQRIESILTRRAERARQRAAARSDTGGSTASGGFLRYPVAGRVTSPFGYRTHPIYGYWGLHDGVDFASGCGSPMYASAPGRVVASYYQTAYGNRLIIDHGYARGVGLATIYNHATSYVVDRGDRVSRGQLIGYMGSTGWSTGCHLHFTVMANGRPVDPMRWF